MSVNENPVAYRCQYIDRVDEPSDILVWGKETADSYRNRGWIITPLFEESDTLRAENERLKSAARSVLEWDARRGYPVPYAVRDPLKAALSEDAQ